MAEKEHFLDVDGHKVRVRNLDKVLYPQTKTRKADVISYYAEISPVIRPHLADRPLTRIRWPDGVGSTPFFEKNLPSHAPDWIRRVEIDSPGSTRSTETVIYPIFAGTAELIWAANMAALELHVPQWTVGPRGGRHDPDRLVIDLDPGEPAGLAQCAEVAVIVRERLAQDGLDVVPVTSGSKGLQLYAAISATQAASVINAYAKSLAEELARAHPALIVSNMAKAQRGGKVLFDWSQNNPAKTTICPYSLRGRAEPWVAAPRTWEELEDPDIRQLSSAEVLARVEADGDLAAVLFERGPQVPA